MYCTGDCRSSAKLAQGERPPDSEPKVPNTVTAVPDSVVSKDGTSLHISSERLVIRRIARTCELEAHFCPCGVRSMRCPGHHPLGAGLYGKTERKAEHNILVVFVG